MFVGCAAAERFPGRIRSPILVGDLEDSEHLMTEAVAQMRDATEVRFDGLGHINAFLASDLQLPPVEAFLAKRS